MKKILVLISATFLISCSNQDKTVLLPHIETSKVNDIKDISPVFIFYNTSKKDSLELNRKNLISTTNWLFNIDKRHQLKKVIPTIMQLQEKRRDAKLHKNEKAKNFFSCNDLEKQTLGFIDFTNANYEFIDAGSYIKNLSATHEKSDIIIIEFKKEGEINVYFPSKHQLRYKHELSDILEAEVFKNKTPDTIYIAFDGVLNFQEYISYKRSIEELSENQVNIANTEFILN